MLTKLLQLVVIFSTLSVLIRPVHADEAVASLAPGETKATVQLEDVLVELVQNWQPTWYPKGKEPETPDQRATRLAQAARIVAQQASAPETSVKFSPEDAAALVLMVWYHESSGEYYVHAGGVSPLGKQDNGRARCMGQIQTWKNNTLLTDEEHKALAGLSQEATALCARTTISYLWYHATRCLKHDWAKPLQAWEVAILAAAYGKGHCVPVGAKSKIRAHTWSKMRAQIRRAKPVLASKLS